MTYTTKNYTTMKKKILVIIGHPDKESYNWGLAQAYTQGAERGGAEVKTIPIADLDFSVNLAKGYNGITPLEPDLEAAIEKLKWCDHMVWVFPMWWYGYPAIMKGFIDRTFLPGITFKMNEGNSFPDKLLVGKTGRIIVTSDTPRWYNYLYMKSPTINQMKKGTLQFCGVSPVKISYISPIKTSTEAFRKKWLDKIEALGANLG